MLSNEKYKFISLENVRFEILKLKLLEFDWEKERNGGKIFRAYIWIQTAMKGCIKFKDCTDFEPLQRLALTFLKPTDAHFKTKIKIDFSFRFEK